MPFKFGSRLPIRKSQLLYKPSQAINFLSFLLLPMIIALCSLLQYFHSFIQLLALAKFIGKQILTCGFTQYRVVRRLLLKRQSRFLNSHASQSDNPFLDLGSFAQNEIQPNLLLMIGLQHGLFITILVVFLFPLSKSHSQHPSSILDFSIFTIPFVLIKYFCS